MKKFFENLFILPWKFPNWLSRDKTSSTLTTEYTFNKYIPDRSIMLSRMKVRQEPPARKGYYPMHPVSTFILPRLSEKVAQNERTLFTFLSSEDKHTLSVFLKTAEGDFPMLTPDYLYSPDCRFKELDEDSMVEMFKQSFLESENNRQNNRAKRLLSLRKRISKCFSATAHNALCRP